MRTILFPIILTAILALLEWYVFTGLRKSSKKWVSKGVRYTSLVLFFIAVVAFIILFTVSMPTWLVNFFFGAVVVNLLSKLLLAVFLAVDDLRRLGLWGAKKIQTAPVKNAPEKGISRSEFLMQSGVIVAAVPAISLPVGMVVGPYNYTLHRPNVVLPNLPDAFHGLRIVQISDIHSGSFYDKEAVNRGIDLLLAQKPDIVFFTGDLVNDRAIEMKEYMDVFSRVKAPLGVYSILGNHDYGDYYAWESEEAKAENLEQLKAIHGKLGWRLLLDEHVYLEKSGSQIGLIGVQNWGAGFHQIGDLKKAYEGCEAPVKLLLSHDPTHWDEEVRKAYRDIDITFSGHTHGAQMGIETGGFKWSPISLRYDKWAGLYRESDQYLYVNRGYGFLGYPGRIGIWPEITVMTLLKNEA